MLLIKKILSIIIFNGMLSCTANHPLTVIESSVATKKNNTITEQSILQLINDYRNSIHLNSLKIMNEVTIQAFNHSKEMAEKKVSFGHDGFDARVENIRKSIGFIYGWAENVAEGQSSAEEVVKDWLQSPGHKKNIEGNYNYTGIGIYKDENGNIYFTQIFIRK